MRLDPKRVYLKASECQNGEEIIIMSEGQFEESKKFTYDDGTPRKQFVIEILHRGESKTMTLNSTNRSKLIEAWGRETSEWLNKRASIELVKVSVGGQLKNSILLNPEVEAV